MSWQDAWREGRTRWDAGASPPALERLVREGALPDGLTVVPGCGSGYDVFTLASPTRPTIGIDVATSAGERFEALRDQAGVDPALARIFIGDFFAWDPGAPVKLWWDYTFLCALEPPMRRRWADKAYALLADDGEFITLLFPVTDAKPKDQGPPYPVSVELARELLEPRFEAVHVEQVHDSHDGRTGMEWLARWRRSGT